MSDFSREFAPGGRGEGVEVVSPSAAPPAPSTVPSQRGRDSLGRFLPKHTENVTTALNTDRLPPHLEYIHREVEQFDAGQLADEGEVESEIPSRRRSQLRYRTVIHRSILGVAAALEHKGLTDKHGKLRLGWLSKLESLINTAGRIDNLLGLERRAKDASLLDLSAAEYAAATQQKGGPLEPDNSSTETGQTSRDDE
jgi:hypothetical protein